MSSDFDNLYQSNKSLFDKFMPTMNKHDDIIKNIILAQQELKEVQQEKVTSDQVSQLSYDNTRNYLSKEREILDQLRKKKVYTESLVKEAIKLQKIATTEHKQTYMSQSGRDAVNTNLANANAEYAKVKNIDDSIDTEIKRITANIKKLESITINMGNKTIKLESIPPNIENKPIKQKYYKYKNKYLKLKNIILS